jgi:hypothetical protein
MLDLEHQILDCGRNLVNKYPRQLLRETSVIQWWKHRKQTISFAGKSFESGRFKTASINLIFCK